MKYFLAYILGFVLLSRSGLSADIDYSDNPCWTGLYIGLNGGWGSSKADWQVIPFGATATADFTPQSQSNQINGALFGGQIGLNWQIKCLVIGAESDFDGTSLNGFNYSIFASNLAITLFGVASTGAASVYANLDWLASVRGRLGTAWGSGFIYFTGGAAWTHLQARTLDFAEAIPVFGAVASNSFRKTKTGWVVGAGYEWKIATKWSVRGEYLYYHFGKGPATNALFLNAHPNGVNVSIGNTNINAFRMGVNYNFRWPRSLR